MRKRKKMAGNSNGAVTVKKRGLKKAHISLSGCQNRVNEECILGFWAAPDAMVMSICPNFAQIWRFEQIVRSPFVLVLEKKKGLWKLAIGLHGCSHRVLWWRRGKAWCPFCPLLSCVPVCNKEAPFYHLFLSSRYGGLMVVYTCWSIKW